MVPSIGKVHCCQKERPSMTQPSGRMTQPSLKELLAGEAHRHASHRDVRDPLPGMMRHEENAACGVKDGVKDGGLGMNEG